MLSLLLLMACTPDGALDTPVEVSATETPSTMRVTWYAPWAEETWLTWRDELGREHYLPGTPDEGVGEWFAMVLAGGDADIDYQIWADGELLATGELTTDAALDLEEDTDDRSVGTMSSATATCALIDEMWVPVILDANGVPRWWYPSEAHDDTCLRVRVDQEGVWFNRFVTAQQESDTVPSIVKVSWSGEVLQTIEAPGHHHDFWVHKDGTVDWIAYEEVVNEAGLLVYLDQIMRTQPDGHTFPIFSLYENMPSIAEMANQDGDAMAWANHLHYDGANYWLSLHNLGGFIRIGEDGNIRASIGEMLADQPFNNLVVDDPFREQHGGQILPGNHLLLHDNSGGDTVRAVQYALDEEAGTATLEWEMSPPDNWWSPALGDAIRTSAGSTRVSWGVFATLEEVNAQGELTSTLTYNRPTYFGYLTEVSLP